MMSDVSIRETDLQEATRRIQAQQGLNSKEWRSKLGTAHLSIRWTIDLGGQIVTKWV